MTGKVDVRDRQPGQLVRRPQRLFLWPLLLLTSLLTLLVAGGCVAPISAIDARPTLIIDTDPLPVIAVAPVVGRPGTTVFVSGAGWEPNDAVFINLAVDEDPEDDENELLEVTVAASTVAADTRFAASFLYPFDPPWSELDEVIIIAYSPDNLDEAQAPFALIPDSALTVTPTVTVTATVTTTITPIPAASSTPTPPSGQEGYGTATVISSGLNVRSGPSTAYPIIRQLRRGATMTVLGQSADTYWLYVRLPDGLLGWVAKYYTDYRGAPPVATPTGAPSPQTPAPPPPASRWVGEYFNNMDLSGEPALTRMDYSLNFNWGYGSPAPQIQVNHFSARWEQPVYFPGGTFRFFADTDDGVRIYVDDVLIIDQWHVSSGVVFTADRTLTRGTHIVRVEYFENTQLANIRVWWDRSDGMSFPDWKGEYYNNRDLSGAPSLVRNDPAIDFNWGTGSPSDRIRSNDFSVRWTRTVYMDADRYRFTARMDDGMRVYLDGNLIIDDWTDGSVRQRSVERDVSAGYHNMVVEYYEHLDLAVAEFWWEKTSASRPSDFPDWKGEYWSNRSLSGAPALVRNDPAIDFNWGTGSPAPQIPSDNFSARWTRSNDFSSGWYRFNARSDDGVRVWVDGDLIIDQWHDGSANVTYSAEKYIDGWVGLQVEYYERYGGAAIQVWWEKTSSPHTATPTKTKTPTPTPTGTPPTSTPTPTGTAATSTPTPTLAVTRSPYAKVQPDSGLPGTSVVVSGGGFPANTTVNIHLASPVRASVAADATVYASTQSDDRGNYSVLVTLPATWPGGSPIEAGELLIVAATPNYSVSASAVFEVTVPRPTVSADPYIELQPRSGGPGTSVVVSGGGFPGNTTISVYLGGLARSASASAAPKAYGSGTSDANGNYRISITMPDTWPDGSSIEPGKLNVVAATANFNEQASAIFDYRRSEANPSVGISPTSGGAGTVVTVTGEGYPANKSVTIHLGTFDESVGSGSPFLYGTTKADASGKFSTAITMPAVWPNGVAVAPGELVIWARTDDSSVQQSTVFNYSGGSAPAPTDIPAATNTPVVPPTATPNAYARVSPSSGGGGTQVIVSGGGFPIDTTVNALISFFDANGGSGDPEIFATTTTNANGDYSMSFTMPSDLPNGQPIASGKIMIVVATNDYGVSASAPFDYAGVTAADEAAPVLPSPEPTIEPSPVPSPEISPEVTPELEEGTPEPEKELPPAVETPAVETPTEEAIPEAEPTEVAPAKATERATEEATDEAPAQEDAADATPDPPAADDGAGVEPPAEPTAQPTTKPVEATPTLTPTPEPVAPEPAPAVEEPPVAEPTAQPTAKPVEATPTLTPTPEPGPPTEAPAPAPAEPEPVAPEPAPIVEDPPVAEPAPTEPAPAEPEPETDGA